MLIRWLGVILGLWHVDSMPDWTTAADVLQADQLNDNLRRPATIGKSE